MTLGDGEAQEALDAQPHPPRERDQIVPLLDHGKRTRIYAVLSYAFRAQVDAADALRILGESCSRKNQEDKQLGAAAGQLLDRLRQGDAIGEALGRILGRMLSAEEAAILAVLATAPDADPAAMREFHAMEMLLRLREMDLLEDRRTQ
ncbi:hypothetical protein BHAOGJBA_4271 [Methylobacterium hispanicum]|uniref:Uncharacterized protein n=1 Tax=Methylobacterium hispanicum TaxID=270350 RepID=A0AAV4ZRF0_9HYPH|nr:hypothetical protein [Methylobacterium hispanicum]GJD90729.1 hypothetical protein BHAOGJBA_4271 [Methylobacterium hispanicum]